MTYQEFNHIYYKFTNEKNGIKPHDSIKTNGYELKEFVEFAMQKTREENNTQLSFNTLSF